MYAFLRLPFFFVVKGNQKDRQNRSVRLGCVCFFEGAVFFFVVKGNQKERQNRSVRLGSVCFFEAAVFCFVFFCEGKPKGKPE